MKLPRMETDVGPSLPLSTLPWLTAGWQIIIDEEIESKDHNNVEELLEENSLWLKIYPVKISFLAVALSLFLMSILSSKCCFIKDEDINKWNGKMKVPET